MIKNNKTTIYSISAKITEKELELAKAYIQGAMHSYSNNSDDAITVRALFGGENRDWHDTPLQVIYDYYDNAGYIDSQKRAAQDVGKLLKEVLAEDKEKVYEEKKGYTKEYLRV